MTFKGCKEKTACYGWLRYRHSYKTWTAWSKAHEIPNRSWICFMAYGIERWESIKWKTGRQQSKTILHASPLCLTASFSNVTSTANSPFLLLQGLCTQVVVPGFIQIMFTVEIRGSPTKETQRQFLTKFIPSNGDKVDAKNEHSSLTQSGRTIQIQN